MKTSAYSHVVHQQLLCWHVRVAVNGSFMLCVCQNLIVSIRGGLRAEGKHLTRYGRQVTLVWRYPQLQ